MAIADLSEDFVEAIAERDFDRCSARERAVDEFAEQVTENPHRVTEDHLEPLFEVRFDGSAIIRFLAIIGKCNTSYMFVSALNITPEDRSDDLTLC